ncbi:MAG: SpoIIE family protein phosphatase [Phycisphaerales bacterium]|nr:SpoIIE family protein phosphatase [Phycisphaerales bacterium]
MRTRPLTVVVAGGDLSASALAQTILSEWPAGAQRGLAPAPMDLEVLLEDPAAAAQDGPGGGLWLVALDGTEPPRVLWQLVDAIERRHAAALVLLPELHDHHRAIQQGGVLVQRRDADPRLLAAMLFALQQRQQTVDQLGRELEIAQASHGGLRGEIDRMHEELALAARVQAEFLPKQMPEVKGLDFAVLFRPAQYVSGDFYSVELVDESKVAFFIADAVGHGVPAALLTMVIARAICPREWGPGGWRTLEPTEVLSRLNRVLCEHQHGTNRFATAIYGIIDAATGMVTLAGAGHPPPLLVGEGITRKIETDGPLLGVFEDAVFEQVTFELHDGRRLLLYTDGFEVAFPNPDAQGRRLKIPTTNYLGRLLRVGEDGPGYDLAERMDALAAALDEQAGSLHQPDDVTALAIASRIPAMGVKSVAA